MKNKKALIIVSVISLFAVLLVVSSAYGFLNTHIEGNDSPTSINATTIRNEATLDIISEQIETAKLIEPGFTDIKIFKVTNTGDDEVIYKISLSDVTNTFERKSDVKYTLYKKIGNNTITIQNLDNEEVIATGEFPSSDKIIKNQEIIGHGEVYTYALKVEYLDLGVNQDSNKGKTFSSKVQIFDASGDIAITNLTKANLTNNAAEIKPAKYSRNTTTMNVKLPANSSITYQGIITDSVSVGYLFDYLETLINTNNNITVSVNLNANDSINANSTKPFTIVLSNNTNITQTGKIKLKYNFKENKFVVKFDANGGSLDYNYIEAAYNSTYGTLPIPTREGYTFLGWNGKNKINSDEVYSNFKIAENTYSGTALAINNKHIYFTNDLVNNPVTFSYKVTVPSNVTRSYSRALINDSGSDGNNVYTNTTGVSSVTVTPSSINDYVKITYGTGSDGVLTLSDIQLEEGSSRTEYEPYYVTNSVNVTQAKNHILKAIWQENS